MSKKKKAAGPAPEGAKPNPAAEDGGVRRGTVLAARYWPLLVAVLTFALYAGRLNRNFYFRGGDNAAYFSLAQALVQGRGYTNIYTYPATPHTKYPPVYPLMLAAVMWGFGENVTLMKLELVLCAALLAWGLGLLVRAREPPPLAAAATLLALAMPFLLAYSILLFSEIPFTAFAFAALGCAEVSRGRRSWRDPYYYLAVAFLVLACLTRSAGLVLMPALVMTFGLAPPVGARLRFNLARAGGVAGGYLLAIGAWTLRCHLRTESVDTGYWQEFLLQDPFNANSPLIGFGDLMHRSGSNAHYYLAKIGAQFIGLRTDPAPPGVIAVGIIIIIAVAAGFVLVVRRRRSGPEFYALASAAMLLFWSFQEDRMLISLYPLMIYYLLKGVEGAGEALARSMKRPAIKWVPLGLIGTIAFCAYAVVDVGLLDEGRQWRKAEGFEVNPHFLIVATTAPMTNLLRLSIWVRQHAGPEAVVMARKSTLVYLAGNRPCVGGPFSSDPAEFIANLEKRNVSYLIIDQDSEEMDKYFIPAITAYRNRFELQYQLIGARNQIYKFR